MMQPILAFIVLLSFVGLVSLVVLLAILPAVPLTGAVVRLRAKYDPRGIQLDPEDGEQPRTGPAVTSFFAMLARVHRIEGWSGLYKGLMPTLLSIPVTSTLFLLRLMSTGNLRIDKVSTVSTGMLGAMGYTLFAIFFLPLTIIFIRAITTPHKLPCFDAKYSLRILLTPAERERPWILYTPGLVAAQFWQIAFIVLGLGTVRRLLLPELSQPDLPPAEDVSGVKLAAFFVLTLAGTIVLAPLEVILIRLAVQPNYAVPQSVPQPNGDAQEAVEYTGMDENVISLRTEQEPYTGLIDCAKKIVEEEGCGALYRAWWWTMLGLAFI